MNIDFLVINWVVCSNPMNSVKLTFLLLLLHGALFADQSVNSKAIVITPTVASVKQTVASGVSATELPTHEWYRTAVLILGVGAITICFAQSLMTFKKKA
jgi:hypothetical protein